MDGEMVAQGHSKNPAGDGGERQCGIGGVGFAGGGHGLACALHHCQREITDGSEWSRAGTDTATVLVHRDVAPPVEFVLDAPMGACKSEQAFGACLSDRQARHEVGDLDADLTLDLARALDTQNLSGTRPAEMWHDLGAGRGATRLEPAMPLLDRCGPTQIKRRIGGTLAGGKGRRSSRRWRHAAQVGSSSRRTGSALGCP